MWLYQQETEPAKPEPTAKPLKRARTERAASLGDDEEDLESDDDDGFVDNDEEESEDEREAYRQAQADQRFVVPGEPAAKDGDGEAILIDVEPTIPLQLNVPGPAPLPIRCS